MEPLTRVALVSSNWTSSSPISSLTWSDVMPA
jgi:hypothetical protein